MSGGRRPRWRGAAAVAGVLAAGAGIAVGVNAGGGSTENASSGKGAVRILAPLQGARVAGGVGIRAAVSGGPLVVEVCVDGRVRWRARPQPAARGAMLAVRVPPRRAGVCPAARAGRSASLGEGPRRPLRVVWNTLRARPGFHRITVRAHGAGGGLAASSVIVRVANPRRATGGSTGPALPGTGGAQPVSDGPAPRVFSRSSPLNLPIPARAEVDAGSREMVGSIVDALRGRMFTLAVRGFTVPVHFADAGTPRHDVDLTASWAPAERLTGVPIPPEARPDPESDGHMAVIDTSTGCEYDFWQASREGGPWSASWANALRTSGDGLFPRGLSARGSGFALLAGLIWPDELAAGRIDHALVFSYPHPRAGGPVDPATESDGTSTRADAIPEGARLQLDPTLDLNALGLSPWERTIARALQEYGMFLADVGGTASLYAMHPSSFPQDPYRGLLPDETYVSLDGIPVDRLQVLRLGPQRQPSLDIVPSGCGVHEG